MTDQIAQFGKRILADACDKNATDIHFYPYKAVDKINVYYRLLGKKTYIRTITKTYYHHLLTYFKFASGMDIGEVRKPQNGALAFYHKENRKYALRLSTLPLDDLESLSIRILQQTAHLPLEQLFVFPKQLRIMQNWLQKPAGMILLTGPTGSGKSSTLYALLEARLKTKQSQIITLEDPIERQIDEVIQVEINERAGVTYQTGLKAALRHDPDVLMIGEIRDEATARFALEASLTGHLVLSTLHAKDALGTIDRLKDFAISASELSQSLIAIAALRLLPIKQYDTVSRRAAIVELLEGELLQQAIENQHTFDHTRYETFEKMKEKAYVYGFISKDTLSQ